MAQFTRNYEYRLRPNRAFVRRASEVLEETRQIYNAALAHRIAAYRAEQKTVTIYDQQKELTELRTDYPDYALTNRSIQREALDRVDKAYQAFFRRIKKGETPGFPRFKSIHRWDSFAITIDSRHKCPLQGDKLTVASVGTVRIRLHRPLPEGAAVKTVRILRRADGWYAVLTIQFEREIPAPLNDEVIGLDAGIANFAALSNGEFVPNPRYGEAGQAVLTQRSQRLAKKPKRKSKRRDRVKQLVAKAHLKVSRQRKQLAYETVKTLLTRFGVICIEDLKIKNMVRNHHLARVISDVAWGTFFGKLLNKAEEAGGLVIKVPPHHTSQTCPQCGCVDALNRPSQAEFQCISCGYTNHADTVGAINIRSRGHERLAQAGREQESPEQAETSNKTLQVACPILA